MIKGMNNKLKTHRYSVAYADSDCISKYKMIRNPFCGFAADPFLFFYDDRLYLFAEIFNYMERKGNIGYSVYDPESGSFSKWKIIISEKWHLSYPFIFVQDNNIYIIPESGEKYCIYLYKAVSFPDVWERSDILYEGSESFVDTTLFNMDGKAYGFTYCIKSGAFANKGELRLFSIVDGKADIPNSIIVTDNISHARGGGKVIDSENECIRVSQDCKLRYGHGICFHKFRVKDNMRYYEEEVKRIYPEDVRIDKRKHILQVHTYNQLNDMKVIDVGYNEYNLFLFVVRTLFFFRNKIKNAVESGKKNR